MHPRASWIEHKGRPIILHDYSNLSETDYAQTVTELAASLVATGQTDLLLLLNAKESYVDKEVLAAFKQAAKDVKPHVSKIAVVGANQVLRFFITLINQFSALNATPFTTAQDAKDWLVE